MYSTNTYNGLIYSIKKAATLLTLLKYKTVTKELWTSPIYTAMFAKVCLKRHAVSVLNEKTEPNNLLPVMSHFYALS